MRYLFRVMMTEYRAFFGDSGIILIFVAGMAIYPAFYPEPYSTEVLKEVPVVAVDQDNSALSRKLLRWLDATEEIQIASKCASIEEARRRVLDNQASGVFAIPTGFERTVLRGEQATVSVYGDAAYFFVHRQVASGAFRAVATLSAGVEVLRLTAAGIGLEKAKQMRDPIPVVTHPLFNPAGGYGTYVVPGALILIMQQTMLIALALLGGGRNEGLRPMPPLRAGHTRPGFSTLLGQGLAFLILYMTYPVFYLCVIFRAYHFPRPGDPITALVFLVPFTLSAIYLGMALSSLFSSREIAFPALLFASMPAIFLIGFVWPKESMPVWLRYLGLLLPSTCGSLGFQRINQMQASLDEVRGEWLTLWALAGGYFLLAWFAARRPRVVH